MRTAFFLLLAILFSSCSNSIEPGRTIVISVASDYSDTPTASLLPNTLNDQAAFIECVRTLAHNVEFHIFRTESMRSFYSQNPIFSNTLQEETIYYLRDDNTLGRRKTNKFAFHSSNEGTVQKAWTIWDVSKLLAELETKENDFIILHYSGHGDINGNLAVGKTGDTIAKASANEILYFMSDDYLKGTKLIVLDSCYSGSFVTNSSLEDGMVFNDNRLECYSILESFRNSFKGSGSMESCYVLAASRDNQTSYDSYSFGNEAQRHFGFFSYHFLKALGYDYDSFKCIRKGSVTLYGLYNEVIKSMENSMRIKATPDVTKYKRDIILFN